MKAGGEATIMPGRRWEEEGMMRGTREKNGIDSVFLEVVALERGPKAWTGFQQAEMGRQETSGGSADRLHKHIIDAGLAWWLRW